MCSPARKPDRDAVAYVCKEISQGLKKFVSVGAAIGSVLAAIFPEAQAKK
jgi:hypothetical protein